MIDKIFPKVFTLEKKVSAIETHLNGLAKAYGDKKIGEEEERDLNNKDTTLKCDKCSKFLGFFDTEQQQFRFNYKGLVIYWVAGVNGNITIICNNCSYANNLGYITCEDQI